MGEAAVGVGLDREGGEEQLTDVFMAQVVERVRPHRLDGHGAAWRLLEGHREQIRVWLDDEGLTVAKVGTLLARQGVSVPPRTLRRFAVELCGPRRGRGVTVRVADGEPGDELQVDFGRMGLVFDAETGRRRVCQALIFTPATAISGPISCLLFPALLRVAHLLADHRGGDRGVRGGLAVLRRGVPHRDPGICSAEHIRASVADSIMWPRPGCSLSSRG